MTERSREPHSATGASQVTVLDTLPPRRPFPAAPTRRAPLSRDLVFDRSAYDEAYEQFQRSDRIGQPAAWGAFRNDIPAGAA